MTSFILGKKIAMSQTFGKDGRVIPVTLVEAGPVFVTQIKTKAKDGYDAIQFGFSKSKKANAPLKGHLKDLGPFYFLRELRVKDESELANLKVGDQINLESFKIGQDVSLVANSKGKGFQGVVKRHGFAGGPKSHGQKDRLRAPGSIGSSFPEHVRKGLRMAGRMGNERVTIKNLEIVDIEKENNLMVLKGAVPGRKGSLVVVRSLEK